MAELPPDIEAAFAFDDPQDVFDALMPVLTKALDADRCFLYLRDPATSRGGTLACWSADPEYPDMRGSFDAEIPDLFTEDPMMGLAAKDPTALLIDDIETAGPEILSVDFERSFGHSALIHAPVYDDGRLLGILEPCAFGEPHHWTEADGALVAAVQQRLGPLAGRFIDAEPR